MAFQRRWTRQIVRDKTHGTMRLHNPIVGPLDLAWETLCIPGDEDQALIVCTAPAGSVSETNLSMLASWHAGTEPGAAPARTIPRDA